MITYLQTRGPDGVLRLQRLDRLPADQQAVLVHGDVERVHQVDNSGSVVEDVKKGKIKAHGKDYTGPSPLAELRAKHKKPKPKGGSAGA